MNDNILTNGEAFLSLRNTTDEVTTITPLVKVFMRMDGFTKEKNLKVPGANFSGDSVDIIVTDIWSNEPYEELTVNLFLISDNYL